MKPRKPLQGNIFIAQRLERILLLCFYEPSGISTVSETVAFIQLESQFPVTVVNLCEHRKNMDSLALHDDFDFDAFDGIIIHNTVAYNVDNLRALDRFTKRKLREFKGAKILMKQDENFRFKALAEYIGATGFDYIFTCLPPEAIEKVYPQSVVGDIVFERMLTGYVTPTLRAKNYSSSPRPIDIGYRGSIQPLSFGRLAFEKRKIGDDVQSLLKDSGLELDISSAWEDRIGGDAWFDFLGSCKATLGSESGASVFDLDGDLDKRCATAEKKLGEFRADHAYAEAYLSELADIEDNVHYHQISPRHFEAAAAGTVQILHPGTYSGILVEGRHYLPLARDYSNLDEIIAFIADETKRSEMAACAFREIIENDAYWIETFVHRLDKAMNDMLVKKSCIRQAEIMAKPAKINVLLLAAHEPKIDPRLGWIEQCAPEGMIVHQLGILPPEKEEGITYTIGRGGLYRALPRRKWKSSSAAKYFALAQCGECGVLAVQEMLFLDNALKQNNRDFSTIFGGAIANPRLSDFMWYLDYLLDTTQTLLDEALNMRGINAVIATDLDTLFAALILKAAYGIPVVYDAHEYWPESDLRSHEYEVQYWIRLERRLVSQVDYCQTVSFGLAEWMSKQYEKPFESVPNCEPLSAYIKPEALPQKDHGSACHFLFQGAFAVGRGIELLIAAWPHTDAEAILFLRGPDNPFKAKMKELAKQTGLLGKRIHFPPAVSESELVESAAHADVGILPYAPSGVAYSHCCPNKMSQYMAAGLPLLANQTSFVEKIVTHAECGIVLSFAKQSALIEAVNVMVKDKAQRIAWGKKAHAYFLNTFHWEAVSVHMYEALAEHKSTQLHLYSTAAITSSIEADSFFADASSLLVYAGCDTPTEVMHNNLRVGYNTKTLLKKIIKRGLIYSAARAVWRNMPEAIRSVVRPLVLRRSMR